MMTKAKPPICFLIAAAIITVMILVCDSLAARKPLEEQKQTERQIINQRLKNQQQRLQDIEELAAEKRRCIENQYVHELNKLQQRAQKRTKRVNISDKLLWIEFVEFIKMDNQAQCAGSYFSDIPEPFVVNKKAHKLRYAMIDSYFWSTTRIFLMDKKARKMLTAIANLGRLLPPTLLVAMEEFESESFRLQNRRQLHLAKVDQWEKDLKEEVFRVMRDIKALPETPTYGVVTAISYGEKDICCMIEGVDERIIRPGTTINNVKLLRIHRNKVEFEKDGKNWVQLIGAPADHAWMQLP